MQSSKIITAQDDVSLECIFPVEENPFDTQNSCYTEAPDLASDGTNLIEN